jgi:hypothetical protein
MGTSHALGYAVYHLAKLYAALSRLQAQLKTPRRGEFGCCNAAHRGEHVDNKPRSQVILRDGPGLELNVSCSRNRPAHKSNDSVALTLKSDAQKSGRMRAHDSAHGDSAD